MVVSMSFLDFLKARWVLRSIQLHFLSSLLDIFHYREIELYL